ncbi:MAG: hypothetical protein JO332_11415 [Planctomycetaceae bacterium]|nr:hypothetical protein [Planctomycetaceae bacterium]
MSFLTTATEGVWVGDAGLAMRTTDGGTWLPTGPTGTGNTLNAVALLATAAPGTATGWAAGAGGVLKKTTNSGTTWTNANSGTTQDLTGAAVIDATHAWVVGANGTIQFTSDGNLWNAQTNPAAGRLLTAVASSGTGPTARGIAVGANGTVVWTNNAGSTWQNGSSGVGTTALRGVALLGATNAVAVGDNGTILKSTNGGGAWTDVGAGLTSKNLLAVVFGDATHGWAAGADGTIVATANGGSTWTLQAGGTSQNLRDVKFGSADDAIAVGAAGTVLRSRNKGSHWKPLTNLDVQWAGRDLNAVAFGTPTRAVAVGAAGGVLVTNDTGDTWQTIPPNSAMAEPLLGVAAVSPTFYVAVGGGATGAAVFVSYDATTNSWTATVAATPPTIALRNVAFAPYSRQGYAVGDSGQIVATKDAGSTWVSEASGTANHINGVVFPNYGLGYAVTAGGEILVRRSPSPPLLSFPPHIGTPYTWSAPVVDGFVNPELSETRRPDTGWNQSLQLSYADGTSQPPCTFQGLRHNAGGSLYLSFDVKADTAFDDDDAIVLLFRGDNPSPRPEHAANDRKIVINPVASSADGAVGGSIVAEGYVAPGYPNNENAGPRDLKSYRWDAGTGAWTLIPASAEIVCKVRAWTPSTGNKCWSVELRIPTTNAAYTDWIEIGNNAAQEFLFSFYVLRVQTGGVVESSWPRDLAISGPADLAAAPLSAFDWGVAKLGSADDGVGVRIKPISYQNIGVTIPTTPPGTLESTIHGSKVNEFHVFVQNDSTTAATNVQATFRIADWGVQAGDPLSGAWHLVPANQSTTNPPPAATVNAISGTTPGVTEYACKWLMNSTEQAEYLAHDHQCILVTLDSVDNVNFTERSSWNNMAYVPASVFERKAYVSSKGFGMEGAKNGAQRFFLHTTAQRFDFDPGKTSLATVAKPDVKREGARENAKEEHPYYGGENLRRLRLLEFYPGLRTETTPVSHYTWAIHAVKQSSRTVRINGHVYPLLEQANGFGYVARHGSTVEDWTSGLSGAVVKKLNDNEYEVTVPANGSALLDSGLEAKEGGRSGGGLLGLILLILLFLLIIFWFLKKGP